MSTVLFYSATTFPRTTDKILKTNTCHSDKKNNLKNPKQACKDKACVILLSQFQSEVPRSLTRRISA